MAFCQVHRLVLSKRKDFFFLPDETVNLKLKELHLQTLTPFSGVCAVFFCKPWGLMTLQREETIPRPVSCFSPSWTICRLFCSWWLPFEPCGGYLEAQPCEVTSKEATFCLLEVTQRDGGILTRLDSAMTWQMLCNELGNKGRMGLFQICRITWFLFFFSGYAS